MREILFRGKNRHSGKWVEGSLLVPGFGGTFYYIVVQDAPFHAFCHEVDLDTIGQFTGRLDKNGKRVFEGDIIRLCNGIPGFDVGVILWDDNDQAYLIVRDPVERVMLDDFGNYGRPEYYEVIGNIHDKPKLLGGSAND